MTRRQRADAARSVPLPTVAASLGYRKDPTDKARWKREGSALSINGARFFDHIAGCGGGGAIDLVIHAEGCGFPEALERLETLAPASPAGSGREWERVRNYLHRKRGLGLPLIDCCRDIGVLNADARGNAVFACRNGDGQETGQELVGTQAGRPFRGMSRGSRKAAGGFWIAQRPDPRTALLVESGIDALSAWSLDGRGQARYHPLNRRRDLPDAEMGRTLGA